jgi:hypothetical protein
MASKMSTVKKKQETCYIVENLFSIIQDQLYPISFPANFCQDECPHSLYQFFFSPAKKIVCPAFGLPVLGGKTRSPFSSVACRYPDIK